MKLYLYMKACESPILILVGIAAVLITMYTGNIKNLIFKLIPFLPLKVKAVITVLFVILDVVADILLVAITLILINRYLGGYYNG